MATPACQGGGFDAGGFATSFGDGGAAGGAAGGFGGAVSSFDAEGFDAAFGAPASPPATAPAAPTTPPAAPPSGLPHSGGISPMSGPELMQYRSLFHGLNEGRPVSRSQAEGVFAKACAGEGGTTPHRVGHPCPLPAGVAASRRG